MNDNFEGGRKRSGKDTGEASKGVSKVKYVERKISDKVNRNLRASSPTRKIQD